MHNISNINVSSNEQAPDELTDEEQGRNMTEFNHSVLTAFKEAELTLHATCVAALATINQEAEAKRYTLLQEIEELRNLVEFCMTFEEEQIAGNSPPEAITEAACSCLVKSS